MASKLGVVLVGACTAAAVIAVQMSSARACSCANHIILPKGTVTDLPRNTVVTVSGSSHFAADIFIRNKGPEPFVAIDVDSTNLSDVSWIETITPVDLLETGDTYEIILNTGDFGGPVAEFSVGDDVDVEAPAAPRLSAMFVDALAAEPRAGSCGTTPGGYFGALRLDLSEVPQGAAYTILEFGAVDEPPSKVSIMRSIDKAAVVLGTNMCSHSLPPVVPGTTYCATLIAYDIAGNHATSNEFCAQAVECEWTSENETNCSTALFTEVPVDDPGMPPDMSGCAIAVGARHASRSLGFALLFSLATLVVLSPAWMRYRCMHTSSRPDPAGK
ncbi:MAG TPA: hypothetical protein VFG83_16170 [Kofleriaceae bacterium]|nr:hypothetical protein [Kofleriaceae bacterium]